MASRRDLFFKYKLPNLRRLLENETTIDSQEQIGGKVLTRAEEKKLNASVSENKDEPTTEPTNLYDNPVPSTSTNGPPLLRAYKKSAQKNIVSKCI